MTCCLVIVYTSCRPSLIIVCGSLMKQTGGTAYRTTTARLTADGTASDRPGRVSSWTTTTTDCITADTIGTAKTISTSCWTATKKSSICSVPAAIPPVCHPQPNTTISTIITWRQRRRLAELLCPSVPLRRRRQRRQITSPRSGRWPIWPAVSLVINRQRLLTLRQRPSSNSSNSNNNSSKRLQRLQWPQPPSSRYRSVRCRKRSVSGRLTAVSCLPTTTTTTPAPLQVRFVTTTAYE